MWNVNHEQKICFVSLVIYVRHVMCITSAPGTILNARYKDPIGVVYAKHNGSHNDIVGGKFDSKNFSLEAKFNSQVLSLEAKHRPNFAVRSARSLLLFLRKRAGMACCRDRASLRKLIWFAFVEQSASLDKKANFLVGETWVVLFIFQCRHKNFRTTWLCSSAIYWNSLIPAV